MADEHDGERMQREAISAGELAEENLYIFCLNEAAYKVSEL